MENRDELALRIGYEVLDGCRCSVSFDAGFGHSCGYVQYNEGTDEIEVNAD